MTLSPDDKRRYSRNLLLPAIGPEGQEKLLGASVLVVGCGALGSITAMYLAGSGVGRIGLVDFDTIDISNLQRQLAFTLDDVGKPKAATLAAKIKDINPATIVDTHSTFLTSKQMTSLLEPYGLVVEGSDNPETKCMVANACSEAGKPCVIGGVSGVNGQVLTQMPGHALYSDFFPEAAAPDGYTPCSLGGILGPLPGIVASVQAAEVVKIITGAGQTLVDRMLLIDALGMTFTQISI